MQKSRLRLIHFHRSKAATRSIIHRYLQLDPALEQLYNWTPNDMQSLLLVSAEKANQLYQDLHNPSMYKQIINDTKRFSIWTFLDMDYPKTLRDIPDPPIVLYGLGDPTLIHHQPSLSVVGTRNPSGQAKQKMHQILTPLVKENWLLVSGMALGIDGYAHRLAIYFQGKTLAVLGSGLASPYPKQHIPLFQELTTNHLVISEYPPNTPPRRYQFPERNRIISALSFGTIVIEAKEKSGSLITVDQALEQGREVFAVPGSPLVEQSYGCHKMIQDGAKLVQNTYDILLDWFEIEEKWCRTLE